MPDGEDLSFETLELRELIEVEDDDFTVSLLHLEAIEPQSVVLGMREPRSGLGLSIPEDPTLDRVRPRSVVAVGDLLGHPDERAGCEDGQFSTHWNSL